MLVAGTSGAGKTSWARRISHRLDLPQVELDALHHGPGWVPRPEFADEVRELAARPAWVCEWQYQQARRQLAARAELVLWLDLPVATVMRQLVVRTVWRRLRRQELWNGNVEPPLRTILSDPEHVIRWAWRSRKRTGQRIHALLAERPDLPVVRVRSHRQAAQWLTGHAQDPPRPGRP